MRSIGASAAVLSVHYDLPVEFFALWLDSGLNYSCGAWGEGDDLEAAQRRKVDNLAENLGIVHGESALDVGCAWGGALARLRREHGLGRAVGLTVSPSQAAYCRHHRPELDVVLASWDSYEPDEPFDVVLNLEALEHFARADVSDAVRSAAYRSYFERCWRWLRPGGRMALQVICHGDGVPPDLSHPVTQLIYGQIFPDSSLPSLPQVVAAAEPFFEVRRERNGTDDYARTLHEWYLRLRRRRPEAAEFVVAPVLDRYAQYLSSCSLVFRRRDCELHRLVFARRPARLEGIV
jgi:cyclopropane-fatty-acyl-phospholipid synthase